MLLPNDRPDDTHAAKLQSTATLIERVIALSVFAALLIGVALVLKPFVTGILFGTILVIATWPLREWFHRRGLPTVVTATLLLLIALVTIGAPAVIAAPGLGERLVDGIKQVQEYFAASPELPGWVTRIPFASDVIGRIWNDLRSPESIFQQVIVPYSAELRRGLIEVARAFAEGVFQLFVALAVATMFWMRGDALAKTTKEIIERLGGSTAGAALQLAADSVRGVAYGIVGTAALQAIAMTIGLAIAGVPGAGLLGFLSLIIALSQIGLLLAIVWGGAAWWLFDSGHTGWAVFIIVWGSFVSTVDGFIRPWLVSFGAAIPLTVVFLGVLGGFIAFGFLGLFIGPTLLGVFFQLLKAWRELPDRPIVPPADPDPSAPQPFQ
ncbi:MAG: AI-2E family transporter [Xanthobacteraceae bacterium]